MTHRITLIALSTTLSTGLLAASTPAWAVGDPPRRLSQAQATAYFTTIQPLLTGSDLRCPTGQRPVSGVVTGGASPAGGSQQTVLTFARGATVTVARSWNRQPQAQMTVRITCSQ